MAHSQTGKWRNPLYFYYESLWLGMVKLKIAGQDLGRVFYFRRGHAFAPCSSFLPSKLPNLRWKTKPKTTLRLSPLSFRAAQTRPCTQGWASSKIGVQSRLAYWATYQVTLVDLLNALAYGAEFTKLYVYRTLQIGPIMLCLFPFSWLLCNTLDYWAPSYY